MRAALESPRQGQTVAGIRLIRGWVFTEATAASVTAIRLVIDGTPGSLIPCCSARADVAAVFPGSPQALHSGWGILFNYGLLSSGFHLVGVQIEDSTGASRILESGVMVIKPGEFEFLDQFDLSTATVRIEGQEIVVEGVQVRDQGTQQTVSRTVRLRWDPSSQSFDLIAEGAVCPCMPAPGESVQRMVDPPSFLLPEGVLPGSANCPEIVQHETLQEAVNSAGDNEEIGVFGATSENVTIGAVGDTAGGKDLFIIKCGDAAQITAADPQLPVITIAANAGNDDMNTAASLEKDIEILGIQVIGSLHSGFKIDAEVDGKVLLRSIRAEENDVGVLLEGDNNEVRGANGLNKNRVGLLVTTSGTHNTIRSSTVEGNTEAGLAIAGSDNIVSGNKSGGQNAIGYVISGDANTVTNNRAENNTADGLLITGSKNDVEGNNIKDNGGIGYNIDGTGNTLRSNRAEDNDGFEYDIEPGNVDAGGNQANGNGISFSSGGGEFE